MEDITIVYEILFNKGKFKGKTETVLLDLEDIEIDDLASCLIDRGYLEFYCNDDEFEIISRNIKTSHLL